jgi:hypothetical protein
MDTDGPDTEYVTHPNRRAAEIMTYDIVSAEPKARLPFGGSEQPIDGFDEAGCLT